MLTPTGSASPSPGPTSEGTSTPSARHVKTPLDKQRAQLERLLKDPSKPAYIPPPPKEKTIRPPREMMKNVQGSSAGAGSGEFHVYKASRRREYERLKIMDEQVQKESAEREFEEKKRQWEQDAEAKTAKNRAKRQKKKEKAKEKTKTGPANPSSTGAKSGTENADDGGQTKTLSDVPFKKRRLVNGEVMVFRKPGEDGEEESDDDNDDSAPGPQLAHADVAQSTSEPSHTEVEDQSRQVSEAAVQIVIHEED